MSFRQRIAKILNHKKKKKKWLVFLKRQPISKINKRYLKFKDVLKTTYLDTVVASGCNGVLRTYLSAKMNCLFCPNNFLCSCFLLRYKDATGFLGTRKARGL